jgi:hypothetical protein
VIIETGVGGQSVVFSDAETAMPALPAVTDAGRDVDGDLRGYRNLLDCLAEVPEPRRQHGIRHWAAAVIIALDGKTVRGARAGQDKAPHLWQR